MIFSSNDSLARIIQAAAQPVADPYPKWHPGVDGLDQSDAMIARRAMWQELREPIVVPWLEGLRIRLVPGNELCRIIYLAGQFEPNEFWWLKHFIKPGMVMIDAGANLGAYAMFCAALVGAAGQVIAIEPSAREYARLIEHVQLNDLDNVVCVNNAVSSREGRSTLRVASEWYAGHNTLGQYAYDATEHLVEQNVALTTIDAIAKKQALSRVDLIKLDVEGAELDAVKGAVTVIDEHRPTILIEVADRSLKHQGATSGELIGFLEGRGYRLYRFDAERRKLVPAPPKDVYDSENLFAVPKEHAASIDHKIVTLNGVREEEADWRLEWINLPEVTSDPPEPEGWAPRWDGSHQMARVQSDRFCAALASARETGGVEAFGDDVIERQAVLNALKDNPNDHLEIVELGAGFGDWCIAAAGVLRNGLLPGPRRTCRCIAVEAEPTHFAWAREHFEKLKIDGQAIEAAVYNYNGDCWFAAPDDPEHHYGQAVHAALGDVRVQCRTLREIMKQAGLTRIDLLHMDIQGAEVDVILDSLDLFAAGAIRYLLVGTHDRDFNTRIRELLDDYMTFAVDVPTYEGLVMTPFGLSNLPVDGMLLARSKVPDPSHDGKQAKPAPKSLSLPRSAHLAKKMPFRHLELTVADERAEKGDLAAVRAIRRWAAQRATVAQGIAAPIDEPSKIEDYVHGYENFQIAGSAERAADFLARLYGHFGFQAMTLGFGLQNLMSHGVTLVSIRHNGNEYVTIQDPYANGEWGLAGHEPASLSRLLVRSVLAPDEFILRDCFPDDRRQMLLASGSDNPRIRLTQRMFDLNDWLSRPENAAACRFLADRIGKTESMMAPADLLLFPLFVREYGFTEHMRREVKFYDQVSSQIVRAIVQNGGNVIGDLGLDAALTLI